VNWVLQLPRRCAELVLDPVQFWAKCVIIEKDHPDVDASRAAFEQGWRGRCCGGPGGRGMYTLLPFDEWKGPLGSTRSWVMEQNKERYPWAWGALIEGYVKEHAERSDDESPCFGAN